jgi:hypothetical protein
MRKRDLRYDPSSVCYGLLSRGWYRLGIGPFTPIGVTRMYSEANHEHDVSMCCSLSFCHGRGDSVGMSGSVRDLRRLGYLGLSRLLDCRDDFEGGGRGGGGRGLHGHDSPCHDPK